MSNALQRILTAVVGAPILLGLTYLGGWYVGGLVLVLALVGQHELYGLAERGGARAWRILGFAAGAALAVWPLVPGAVPVALAALLAAVAWLPFTSEEHPLASLGATVLGALYPAVLLAFVAALRLARGASVGDAEAFYLTLGVFLMIWATDTLAYYTGKTLGRHPLAPRVSPKKTWEGSVGGTLGAVLAAVALKLTWLAFLDWVHVVVVALVCGVVSQLGDLAESKLKRSVGAKDSGTLLPGHGGVLDRFDALLLAAPLVYLYLAYVARVVAPVVP